MKLCTDCKWSEYPGEFMRCRAPQNAIGTGFHYRWPFARHHRQTGFLENWLIFGGQFCGKAGRWWEPKP